MRHVGKNKSTEARYAVASMALPDDNDHCLVIEYDTLPIRYQDSLMNVVFSKDAQNETKLLEILSKRRFPDGSIMSKTLFETNRFLKVKVDDVIMTPDNSHHINLREINDRLSQVRNEKHEQVVHDEKNVAPNIPQNNFNANRQATNEAEKKKIANHLLLEADLIERQAAVDASARRERAYNYNPALRPGQETFITLQEESDVEVDELIALVEGIDSGPFIDEESGKEYKTNAALKAAQTRRKKADNPQQKITD